MSDEKNDKKDSLENLCPHRFASIRSFNLSYQFSSCHKILTPADTGMINDSVWCIKDRFVNAYIFRGKTGYLMTDVV
jgi:hypothetical protein